MKNALALVSLVLTLFAATCYAQKPNVPDKVIKSMGYLVGDWVADVELGGESRTLQMSVKPMEGEIGYVIEWKGPGGPGNPDTQMTAIGGWDPEKQVIREVGFATNGDHFNFVYRQVSDTQFEGEGSGTYTGKTMREKLSVNRTSPNQFIWKATDIVVGDKRLPDEEYRFRRVEKHAGSNQSSHAEFQEFSDLLVGRWVGDITLVYDWPGQAKKAGDKITSHDIYKRIADKSAIEWEHFGGTASGKTLIVWDAPSKSIKAFHAGSAGGTWQTVIWKETNTKWGWRFTGGGLADGRAFSGAGYWLFAEGGKKLTITGKMKVDGEAIPEFDDVYHRVSD